MRNLSLRVARLLPNLGRMGTQAYSAMLQALHAPLLRRARADAYHQTFSEFVSRTKEVESPRILEIGSRILTGSKHHSCFPHAGEYVGLDILPGAGVDIVCDVHEMSKCVPRDHFDFVYSISVFEHLLFPWKAAMEINSVLKTGGEVLVFTHPVWPPHELPWDFWRFPVNGFHALFNAATGFEIVGMAEGLPCKMYSLVTDAPTLGNCLYPLSQGVAVRARKVGGYRSDLIKWDVSVADVLESTYPSRSTG